MIFWIAKLLQLIGFAHVGYALWVGVTQNAMGPELQLLMLGAVIFGVGRLIERRAAA
jgi:hypothetical protein